MQIEKSRKNLYEVLSKFYFKFNKSFDKICEILEQILKKLKFFKSSFLKHNIKLRQNKLLTYFFTFLINILHLGNL